MKNNQDIKGEKMNQSTIDTLSIKLQIEKSVWDCVKEGALVGSFSALAMWGVTKLLNKYGN